LSIFNKGVGIHQIGQIFTSSPITVFMAFCSGLRFAAAFVRSESRVRDNKSCSFVRVDRVSSLTEISPLTWYGF
jgi:hypothetical protein